MARSYTPLAINTLAGIAASRKAPAAARVGAAEALLNRGWGRTSTEHDGDSNTIRVTIRQIIRREGQLVDVAEDAEHLVIEHDDSEGQDG